MCPKSYTSWTTVTKCNVSCTESPPLARITPGLLGCIVELKCNMELEDVKNKRKTGELPLSKFGGKSEVWNHFKQVVGSDNICVGFVECIKCGTLFA